MKEIEGCLTKLTSVKKSKFFIYLRVGLLWGSFCKMLETRFFKLVEVVTCSGNEKEHYFIFL